MTFPLSSDVELEAIATVGETVERLTSTLSRFREALEKAND